MDRLAELIKHPSQVAKAMGVSYTTVQNWIKLNAIPPKRIIGVAHALDVEIPDLLPFAKRATTPVKVLEKTEDDLDALLAAYENRPYTTRLPERSVKTNLRIWGDRLPLFYKTLKALKNREVSLDDAAATLGITKSAINNIRKRYGIAPGPKKAAKKALGRYKQVEKDAQKLVLDVIAGRLTARAAAQKGRMSLRTVHRHLADALRPHRLNEISHWSRNFRSALAYEVENGSQHHISAWRQWAESRNLILRKTPKWPIPPKNWRLVSMRRLMVAFLSGEKGLEEMAAARGGEPSVLLSNFKAELNRMEMPALGLSIPHQGAVAEILLAMDSPYRSGAKH